MPSLNAPPDEVATFGHYQGPIGRMLELGNKKNKEGLYKTYFEREGWEHVSVDLNGKDGALSLDLGVAGSLAPLGLFDVVTNFGTSEHVENQAPVWENIHNAIKVGGYLISVTPRPTYWCEHGRWYPHPEFYQSFAETCGYLAKVIDIYQPRQTVCAALRKMVDKPYRPPHSAYMYINVTGRKVGAYE